MQDRQDARQDLSRKGQWQYSKDAGQVRCRTELRQDRSDAVLEQDM